MKKTLFLILTSALAVPAFAQDEQVMTMADVPPPVLARAETIAMSMGVTIDSVGLDLDNGTATYEFAGKLPSGMAFEIDVDADGTVEELEEQIEAAAVPQPAMDLVARYLPGFAPELVEKSTRGDFVVFYELEGNNAQGNAIDVEVRADGRQILIQDDLAG